jgi:hypothetical protein
VNWAGALAVALREGVGTTAAGAVAGGAEGFGTGTTGGGLVSVSRPLEGTAGFAVLTLGVLTDEMTAEGGRAEYLVEKVAAGGAPVTVTTAVPQSQGLSSDSSSVVGGLPAAPPVGFAAPPVG